MRLHDNMYGRTFAGDVVGPLALYAHIGGGDDRWHVPGPDDLRVWRTDGICISSDPGDNIITECPAPRPAEAPSVDATVALTKERGAVHGDWQQQSTLFDNLMWQLTHSKNWDQMGPMRRGALTNIAQKMSRICTGDFDEPDHFDDIKGYAHLGNGGHR